MRVPGRVCLFVAVLLALPQIASAVELTLPDKVPAHYAREVEQGGRKVIVFGTGSTSYEPKVLDQILSGYGLGLRDPAKVPAHYAREVEQGGRKVIVFGTGSTSYEPKVLDQVLEGYTYEQCGEQFSSWGEAYPVPPQFV